LNIEGALNVDIDPVKLLHPDVRKLTYDLHFIAVRFDLALFLDCISLILLTLKVWENIRFIPRVNFISLTLSSSFNMMIIWLLAAIIFNFIMTVLAQSIYGDQIVGF
jgi:predicted small integral membrane protein